MTGPAWTRQLRQWLLVPFEQGSRSITVAVVLVLAALAMPPIILQRKTFDYVVVFDITQSMDVEDYDLGGRSVSRLTVAREAVKRALGNLPCGSRVGWAAFAEYRTILLLAPIEVCKNYNDLLSSLDRIDGRMRWANASEVTKGVYWAMRAARDVGGNPSILFLTDGQEAPPLSGPGLPLFDDLKPGDIRGWMIGVGGYTPQRIPRTDDDGKRIGYWHADEVIQPGDIMGSDGTIQPRGRNSAAAVGREQLSAVREPHLQSLARSVGFEYAHLQGPESLTALMEDSRFSHRRPAPADLGWIPALLALAVLSWRFRF